MNNIDPSSKLDNRYTQQSSCTSEESCDFVGGFQYNLLPAPLPNKSKFAQFDGIPKSQLKIRQTQDPKKPSIRLQTDPSSGNFLTVDNPNAQKEGSFIDIKISNYPSSGDLDSVKKISTRQNLADQNSSKNLHSSGKIEANQLRKSETEPNFTTVNNYEEFSIKTNLVKQEKNFKKQKEKMLPTSNSNSMTFLSAMAPAKSTKMDASRVINQTRITLKDYLFMANTSAKKAAEDKRKVLNESKKLKTEPSKLSIQSQNPNGLSNITIRDRFQKQKYHISNDKMSVVVKQSIQKEVCALQAKMLAMNEWMETHQTVQGQQLIQLYSIRRELQEYNKKFQESFQRLHMTDFKMIAGNICEMSMVQDSLQQSSDIEMLEEI